MNYIYRTISILDFGMYEGYELGIVYVFDPAYVEWCIITIDGFHIIDIEELEKNGIFYHGSMGHLYRMIGDPTIIEGIDIFATLNELKEFIDLDNPKYRKFKFSQKTLVRNKENLKIHFNVR